MDYSFSVAGFFVGFLVGLTGVGGGALMTPVLILLLNTAPKVAIATDLLFAAVTKIAGLTLHGSYKSIDWQIVRRLAVGSLPAAAIMGVMLHLIGGSSPQVDRGLLFALGLMLLLTAAGMMFKPWLHGLGRRLRLNDADRFKRYQAPLTVAAGAVMGVVVTLTSVGAGALGAVLLLYLYPLRLNSAKVVGTDLAHAIPLALVGSVSYLAMGSVDFVLLGNLLTGSIPGVLVGAWCAQRAPDRFLRLLLAFVLAASGWKILN